MVSHTCHRRVRYGETDRMGYLYYGNYPLYYEVGRVELLRGLGLTYREVEEDLGVVMPVVNMHARYLRPARYDDEVRINTQIRSLPDRQLVFHHELYGLADELLNGGRVTLCFAERGGRGRRISCPEPILDVLRPHFP